MMRTRDFLLFLLSAGFLVLAILITAKDDETNQEPVKLFEDGVEETIYSATVDAFSELNRAENLAHMREKLAENGVSQQVASAISATLETSTDLPLIDNVDLEDEVADENEPLLCANYHTAAPLWTPQGLSFEVVEGARILYRHNDIATSGNQLNGEMVLQLPLRSTAQSAPSCISTDVVGVALDGSLIRNNEQNLYSIFGADSLIGYALDGFPIYGLNETVKADRCGGLGVGGQYRYYLSSERTSVLGCFAGVPVNL
ncbi:MAG: hypothetical protein H6779_05200 [Candidatus Nomurabacteria bacterium]|nr:MAG: hypothetical protein H6779_05200 [Candidatus Nomurabacteria bacterium]